MVNFSKEVLEQQKKKIWGAVIIKPTWFYQASILTISVVTVIGFIFLFFASYFTKSTVSGVIEPSAGGISIHALQSGYISQVSAQEGDLVKKGQVLLKISAKQITEQGQDYDLSLKNSLLSDKERLIKQKEILAKGYILSEKNHKKEHEDLLVKYHAMSQQKILIAKNKEIAQEQYEKAQQAFAKGAIAAITLSEFELRYQQAQREHIGIEEGLHGLQNSIEKSDIAKEQMHNEYSQKIYQIEQIQAELDRKILEAERIEGVALIAPIDGVMTQLNPKLGQFVKAGAHLGDLMKENDEYVAKLFVPTHAIGLVEEGLSVSMRVHAYPYEQYGTLSGKIQSIAKAPIMIEGSSQSGYIVYVKLDHQYMLNKTKQYPLKQGLTLDADIKKEQVTFIQKILEPLRRVRKS